MIIPWASEALQQFGQQVMGVDDLAFNDQGVAGLTFDSGETLFFQCLQDQFFISVLYEIEDYDRLEHCQTVMKACHYQCGDMFQVKPSLLNAQTLALSLLINQQEATHAYLDAAITRLRLILQPVIKH